jgi:excisionase family DNA binding protein
MCLQALGALGRNQNHFTPRPFHMQLPMGFTQEEFVDGQRAAEFLGLPRKTLLNLAGRGSVPAHPIGDGMRHTSRFRHAGEAPTLMSILDDPQNQPAAQSQFEPLLDPKQAAVLLRVHQKTLVRLAREGRVPAIRVAKHWRFRASTLNLWLAGQETGVASSGQSD